jgi:hypothetical protein
VNWIIIDTMSVCPVCNKQRTGGMVQRKAADKAPDLVMGCDCLVDWSRMNAMLQGGVDNSLTSNTSSLGTVSMVVPDTPVVRLVDASSMEYEVGVKSKFSKAIITSSTDMRVTGTETVSEMSGSYIIDNKECVVRTRETLGEHGSSISIIKFRERSVLVGPMAVVSESKEKRWRW